MARILSLWLVLMGMMMTQAQAASRLDTTPRIAVLSAFEPEWQALIGRLEGAKTYSINGMSYVTGTLEGKPVVLAMSGMSMVNAAMTTQILIDRFQVGRIVFSGIAGGIDPALNIGDVVVPARWAQSLETIMGRKTDKGYVRPDWLTWAPDGMAAHGMMIPNSVVVGSAAEAAKPKVWFDADPALLAVAAKLEQSELAWCTRDGQCLAHRPKLHVGGEGVSSSAFVDNADYRDYLHRVYTARVTDMESAAVAQVAFANGVPFIVFRSLSDLAGGDEHANQMAVFMTLAAENSAAVVCRFIRALP
ncbi:5'-methylthioadenosine/S-adenosylhomocysteine nucleosidase [Asticcacaulis sp. BYS171W]|uniref:5'-methylthioadenosine/S-adenosylhomocysteine nucleosidase n=1 Tax=Asticcacaulis aquaticus TaxID=2984212 RepID=A0ABT5HU65_9CAUL|nr:5'-methylthioadenosine/S-adenosylhomocysteine nucleosidase [Asticcacaulis aquaticus]MDC7683608.1 5'-methylthioadenosine/S-adenosylhomocysteine nucleosidase [Asticcacaulis aquaticus]